MFSANTTICRTPDENSCRGVNAFGLDIKNFRFILFISMNKISCHDITRKYKGGRFLYSFLFSSIGDKSGGNQAY